MTDRVVRTAEGAGSSVSAITLATILALASGCVSVQVESLTEQHYPLRSRNHPLQVLSVDPSHPSVNRARIIVMR